MSCKTFFTFPAPVFVAKIKLAGAEGFEPPSPVLETGSLAVELTPLFPSGNRAISNRVIGLSFALQFPITRFPDYQLPALPQSIAEKQSPKPAYFTSL
jgi:hypothetical protein